MLAEKLNVSASKRNWGVEANYNLLKNTYWLNKSYKAYPKIQPILGRYTLGIYQVHASTEIWYSNIDFPKQFGYSCYKWSKSKSLNNSNMIVWSIDTNIDTEALVIIWENEIDCI
jgi:hypothetical protein